MSANAIACQFGVKEGSVRAYSDVPMFVRTSGMISLRPQGEIPDFTTDLINSRGAFRLGPDKIAVLLPVDTDLMRGSSRHVTTAVGASLGVAPRGMQNLRKPNEP